MFKASEEVRRKVNRFTSLRKGRSELNEVDDISNLVVRSPFSYQRCSSDKEGIKLTVIMLVVIETTFK